MIDYDYTVRKSDPSSERIPSQNSDPFIFYFTRFFQGYDSTNQWSTEFFNIILRICTTSEFSVLVKMY
uniref:Uncharacterized protein n=1 Tax=Oryza brachyantha TaxID=4533 RepID=J3LJK8_ORYBR